jgi:peptide deformylase
MAVREVITHPNEVLRRKARKVTEFGPDLQDLIDDMVETMREAPGVGLAAPQVDVSLRVITVEFGDEEDPDIPPKLYVVVNPEIIRPSMSTNVGTEGCLSIPGFVGDVERPEVVNIKGLNRFGKPVRIKAKGWLARIFQHEVDHLNGILFIDLAEKIYQVEDETAQVIPAD